jgi:ubiquinone/menaquinone biosynthesis C-methylase UbiE
MRSKQRYYDLFSSFYDRFVRFHSGDRQESMRDFLVEVADVRADQTVVDLCTGTGATALRLARAGTRVIGIDFSAGMLREAQRKAVGHAGIQWVRADVRALPVSSCSVDRVTCSYAMYELSGAVRRDALQEVLRILKPGGKFVMMEHLPPKRALVKLLYLIRIYVLGSREVRSFAGSEEGELRGYFDRVGTVVSEGERTKAVFGFKPVLAGDRRDERAA